MDVAVLVYVGIVGLLVGVQVGILGCMIYAIRNDKRGRD